MSTKGKEYQLAIRVAGIVDKSFDTSLVAAKTSVARTAAAVDRDFAKLDRGFDKIMGVGKKAFFAIEKAAAAAAVAAAVAAGAAAGASVKVGMEFESAFAGVKKTVDATEMQFAGLRDDILGMTREIPSSGAEIAKVMEIAGQLGIARESLADFSRTIIDLEVSTDMVSEEAAASLAKFANIVNMADYGADGISNWERLGSVVVDLGNHFATTESEIVGMSTRLASTGDLVGLTEPQIMALSTAMSSLGIQEDNGGTSMSKLLKKMQVAVELDSDSLGDYASMADMTTGEFAKAFQKDAVVALSAFVDGLNDVDRNGRSAIAILNDMGINEARLSNTVLALANADGLMSEAVETANAAWEENNALAIEAGRRYETAESKVLIMRNAFEELGISAYEELRGPFVQGIEGITQKVYELNEYVSRADGLSKWMKNAETQFPTLQRKFNKYAEPVFSGILNIGTWILKHGNKITSTLVGIGAAMAAYKTASGISHMVQALTSLGSLNPVTLKIMGATAAIGALSGAIALYKQHERDLINQNLADHFGNIALSMEELQQVAEYIVSSKSLENAQKALDEFDVLNSISAEAKEAVAEIEKMNWKISIGMELTADEQESYKQAVENYAKTAQEYALQSQYAVSLNLGAAFSEEDLESQNVVAKVNQFYQDKYGELEALGTQLNEALTNAFNDGLLDIEETKTIAEIQRKMAEIEQSLATGEFQAQLSVLGMKYSGEGLTADSFLNLQEEISNQVEKASESYQKAYVKNYASIQATHDEGGYLNEEEYQRAIEELQNEYLANIAGLRQNGAEFLLNTVAGTYGDEIELGRGNIQSSIQDTVDEFMKADGWQTNGTPQDWADDILITYANALDDIGLDSVTQKALGELYGEFSSIQAELERQAEEFAKAGKAIPEETQRQLNEINMLGALSGNEDAIYTLIGQELGESEEYATVIELARTQGAAIPEELIEAMLAASPQASEAAQTIIKNVEKEFEGGVEFTIPVNYDIVSKYYSSPKGIPGHANGGIITSPQISWLAEGGYPESVIPLDGSRNAIDLWEKTGQLLGMKGAFDNLDLSAGGSTIAVEYNPTYQFYGEAPSKEDLTEAAEISQEEFNRHMEEFLKTHSRVAY